ncbi:MAG: DNA-directed RNA polymerase subunit K [Nanoarchaeota archaeon]|mgnify:CR=1 FL=1
MKQKIKEEFTKYEIARIIGTRALQIAMDAPILLKLSKEELENIKYEALRIAEMEFKEGALPITIHRPNPRKGREKLSSLKEDTTSDEELIEKAKEVEQEIVENPEEYSLVEEEEEVGIGPSAGTEEA